MKENIGVKQSNVSKPDHPICSLGDYITGGEVGKTGWLFCAYEESYQISGYDTVVSVDGKGFGRHADNTAHSPFKAGFI